MSSNWKWCESLVVAFLLICCGWLTGFAKIRAVFTSTWESGEMCRRGEGQSPNRTMDYRFSNPMDEPFKWLQWKIIYWAKVFPSGWLTLWAWHDVLLVWGSVAWTCLGGIEYRCVEYILAYSVFFCIFFSPGWCLPSCSIPLRTKFLKYKYRKVTRKLCAFVFLWDYIWIFKTVVHIRSSLRESPSHHKLGQL